MKQIQPFQKHWLQITSIVVCRLNLIFNQQQSRNTYDCEKMTPPITNTLTGFYPSDHGLSTNMISVTNWSEWRLSMVWCRLGARPSAIIMMTEICFLHIRRKTIRHLHNVITQQTHYAIKRRHFDVKMTSFWRYKDVIITSCIQWKPRCPPHTPTGARGHKTSLMRNWHWFR